MTANESWIYSARITDLINYPIVFIQFYPSLWL